MADLNLRYDLFNDLIKEFALNEVKPLIIEETKNIIGFLEVFGKKANLRFTRFFALFIISKASVSSGIITFASFIEHE